jgi:hypothetical protein
MGVFLTISEPYYHQQEYNSMQEKTHAMSQAYTYQLQEQSASGIPLYKAV